VGQSEIYGSGTGGLGGAPRDTNQLAKLMVDILTGEVEDRERTPEERGVDPAASAMGKKGGPARAANRITFLGHI
jgi:hypothetical protein